MASVTHTPGPRPYTRQRASAGRTYAVIRFSSPGDTAPRGMSDGRQPTALGGLTQRTPQRGPSAGACGPLESSNSRDAACSPRLTALPSDPPPNLNPHSSPHVRYSGSISHDDNWGSPNNGDNGETEAIPRDTIYHTLRTPRTARGDLPRLPPPPNRRPDTAHNQIDTEPSTSVPIGASPDQSTLFDSPIGPS